MAIAVETSLQQLFDNSGNVLNGGSVTVYAATTTTPVSLYTDTGLSSGAANPITLDAYGRHAMRYMAAAAYKLLIKDSAGNTLSTRDSIDPGVPIGSGILAIANGGTGASSAAAAIAALGGATSAEVAAIAAAQAALSGTLASTEKTHIATGTTAQRPGTPVDGDIRRNTTIPQWEGYSGAAAAWQKFNTSTETTAEIAAAQGLVYLSTVTASASTTIDITTNLGDTYEEYVIKFSSVKMSVDDSSLNLRVGTGGTPTFQTSGYEYTAGYTTSIADMATLRATAAASILMNNLTSSAGIGNASGEYARGEVRFTNPEGSDYLLIEWAMTYMNAAEHPVRVTGAGAWLTTGAITGIRFLPSSGNIASGTFRHYGIRKS